MYVDLRTELEPLIGSRVRMTRERDGVVEVVTGELKTWGPHVIVMRRDGGGLAKTKPAEIQDIQKIGEVVGQDGDPHR